ncbi:hypothetical protein [Bradyrhizobium sp. 21]|uniref:hypothetical protein n=1 Tax=Bradyrhizobium sp. 21 TaxID=2782666 RepID=UPI001FFA12D6|nr:hypothetical protein [Bradyrhizobium sp. 21]MCK1388177.1 hypothetical protein [Bradyrhizobium sp. 21]
MANSIGELLLEILNAFIRDVVYSLWLKAVTSLGTKVHNRAAAIVLAAIMGLGLFFLMPVVSGLLGL